MNSNPNLDMLSVRKAVHQSYSNESLRQRQRYRHELAKERRAKMENQKLMKWKIKELREQEKKISQRYSHRNNYGNLIGEKQFLKSKIKEEPKIDSSIAVLLPIPKSKDARFDKGIDYGEHSGSKIKLPPGKEDVCAYEAVKAARKMCEKCGKNKEFSGEDTTRCVLENGVTGLRKEAMIGRNIGFLHKNNKTILIKAKSVKRKSKDPIEPHVFSLPSYRYGLDVCKAYACATRQHNPSPEHGLEDEGSVYNCYRHREGDNDRLAGLTVLRKATSTNTYDLLIVNDGPRSEEIRVKQKSCSNPKPFDILIIKEKLPKSPNTL